MEIELVETELMVEGRKTKAEGLRVFVTSRVVLCSGMASGIQLSKVEARRAGATARKCSKELAVGFGWSASESCEQCWRLEENRARQWCGNDVDGAWAWLWRS